MKRDATPAELRKNPSFKEESVNRPVYPARVIVLSFLAVILVGTILLMMPFSTRSGSFTDPLTAAFTATTSTCVTGLVVVDTGDYWSIVGQIIILLLIQIGGLGLVTLTAFFTVIFRRKLGLGGMELAQASTGSLSFRNLNSLVKLIVLTTLGIEAVGAVIVAVVAAVVMADNGGVSSVDALFEVFSAFGTVGVTAGITPTLGALSKIVLILTMFCGRVGTFSIFMALTLKEQEEKTKTVLPEGEITVG